MDDKCGILFLIFPTPMVHSLDPGHRHMLISRRRGGILRPAQITEFLPVRSETRVVRIEMTGPFVCGSGVCACVCIYIHIVINTYIYRERESEGLKNLVLESKRLGVAVVCRN